MDFFQKIKPEWPLRLGLGLMYLYSGFDLFYHPNQWYGFIPAWFSWVVTAVIPLDAYLRMQGAAEFMFGLLFLAWFSGTWGVRIAAILAAIEMVFILLFVGINTITFRDIGLLGGILALLSIVFQKRQYEQA